LTCDRSSVRGLNTGGLLSAGEFGVYIGVTVPRVKNARVRVVFLELR